MTMAQQSRYEQPIFHSPGSRGPYPMINFDVPSLELTNLMNSHYCPCGPGCDCPFCAAHPYNDATRARVQDLGHILAMDNRPQFGYGDCPTNGTNIESVMGQGFPPLDEEPLSSATFRSPNALTADPALQPTIDEEGFVENSNHFSEPSYPRMRNSEYYHLEYPVNSYNTEADEEGLYDNDCNCGCGQGHNGLPNA